MKSLNNEKSSYKELAEYVLVGKSYDKFKSIISFLYIIIQYINIMVLFIKIYTTNYFYNHYLIPRIYNP